MRQVDTCLYSVNGDGSNWHIKAIYTDIFIAFLTATWKKSKKWHEEDKMFIFIVILTAIIISVDYALVIKFIEILKSL